MSPRTRRIIRLIRRAADPTHRIGFRENRCSAGRPGRLSRVVRDTGERGLTIVMITPLQPRAFFRGVWRGEGELIPNPMLRLMVPRERFQFSSEATWLSDTIWVVED